MSNTMKGMHETFGSGTDRNHSSRGINTTPTSQLHLSQPRNVSSTSGAASLQQPVTLWANTNVLRPSVDLKCPYAGDSNRHSMGIFCSACRGIMMPWNQEITIFRDAAGAVIRDGPTNSILAGVSLQDPEEIAVLSVTVYLDTSNLAYTIIPGMIELMARHPLAVQAGQRMADLWTRLRRMVREGDRMPQAWNVVHGALMNPTLTVEHTFDSYVRSHIPSSASPFGELPTINTAAPTDMESKEDGDGEGLRVQSGSLGQVEQKGEQGPWRFVESTNLNPAVLGRPSTRWTQAEKDKLEQLFRDALEAGVSAKMINWPAIATDLEKHFASITQKKGEPLARWSKKVDGEVVSTSGAAKKLVKDRIGIVARTSTAVKVQAWQTAEIWKLLSASSERIAKRNRKAQKGERGFGSDLETEEVSEGEDSDEGQVLDQEPSVGGRPGLGNGKFGALGEN